MLKNLLFSQTSEKTLIWTPLVLINLIIGYLFSRRFKIWPKRGRFCGLWQSIPTRRSPLFLSRMSEQLFQTVLQFPIKVVKRWGSILWWQSLNSTVLVIILLISKPLICRQLAKSRVYLSGSLLIHLYLISYLLCLQKLVCHLTILRRALHHVCQFWRVWVVFVVIVLVHVPIVIIGSLIVVPNNNSSIHLSRILMHMIVVGVLSVRLAWRGRSEVCWTITSMRIDDHLLVVTRSAAISSPSCSFFLLTRSFGVAFLIDTPPASLYLNRRIQLIQILVTLLKLGQLLKTALVQFLLPIVVKVVLMMLMYCVVGHKVDNFLVALLRS